MLKHWRKVSYWSHILTRFSHLKRRRRFPHPVCRIPHTPSRSTVGSAPRRDTGYRRLRTSERSEGKHRDSQLERCAGVAQSSVKCTAPAGWSACAKAAAGPGPGGPDVPGSSAGTRSACWCLWRGWGNPAAVLCPACGGEGAALSRKTRHSYRTGLFWWNKPSVTVWREDPYEKSHLYF